MKSSTGMPSLSFFLGLVVVVLLLTGAPTMTSAQCNIQNLSPCLPAVTGPASPTSTCCSRLRAQRSCFCSYLKNPVFRRYYNRTTSNKISKACGISIPSC